MKLQFNGRFLSQVITNNNGQGKWGEISLYKTNDDLYIAQYMIGTSIKGYKDEVFCCICKKAKDIKNFFDEFNINNELTDELYKTAGLTFGEEIEFT